MGVGLSCPPANVNITIEEQHHTDNAVSASESKIVEVTDEFVHNMSDIKSFGKFLNIRFSFGEYLGKKLTKSSRRILCIGMGGGCDIFTAYSICLRLNTLFGEKYEILYANTKSAKFLKTDLEGHERITEGLWKLPPKQIVLEKGSDKSCYGTSKLSQSVPRHPNGSPYILVLPSASKNPAIATRENEEGMINAFKTLKADLIIGVDTGGDCITGGMDWKDSVELARDVQMQNAIVKSGIPHLVFAFGPGCDGESSVKTMNEAVGRLEKQGCFLGAFPLSDYLPLVRRLTKNLNPMRTPNICYSAMMGEIPSENGLRVVEGLEYLKLVRPFSTRWIPRTWLRHGIAFDLSTSGNNGKANEEAGKSDEL